MAGEDPQSAVAGCRLDPSNKQTTFQKSGYQWRHTTRSGRRKGSLHSQSFPTSAFRRRVTSQSALRDHPSGSSFNTDLDSRMGMKRIQPSDDFDQRGQSGRSTAAQEQVLAADKAGEIADEILGGVRNIIQRPHSPDGPERAHELHHLRQHSAQPAITVDGELEEIDDGFPNPETALLQNADRHLLQAALEDLPV